MRPVSAAWASTISGSHDMVVRATVCSTFQSGTSPTGVDLAILDGMVGLDGSAAVRSTLDLTIAGAGMWPAFATDPITPYGNEIYVERGVKYSDVLIEMVGLGYFRIETPEQADTPDGPIRITGQDRMQGIINARLLAPVQFAVGVTAATIVNQLVLEIYPSAVIEWDSGSSTIIGRSVVIEEDRWQGLDDLITSLGKIWYWDHRGYLVIKDLPDPSTTVADIYPGRNGVLVQMSRTLTREGVYNAVVATGDGVDSMAAVRGVAIDNSPDSPTYFYGRFGQEPRFFTSSFMTTALQAQAAAENILRKQLGLPYTVRFGQVPNPALEPWDAVRVRPGVNEGRETHIIDTLRIPLSETGVMDATTLEQTVVLIGAA